MLVSLQTKEPDGYQQSRFTPGLRRTLRSLISPMNQKTALPEGIKCLQNCDYFCYPWVRLECVGCGLDRWHQIRGDSFPLCIECRHQHSQEFNTWVSLSQVTGTVVNSPEICQEALSLFESKEHLGQTLQWYHHELQKLEQREREN